MKNLNEIAFKMNDLQAPMKVMVNYLDCIMLQVGEAKNNQDRELVLYSLVNTHGIENMIQTLEMLSDQVEELASLILDYSNEEEGTDDE
ncbi:hypothetical protein CYR81_06950 [Enterococcus faecalis]|uniref:hypothetical protein n=1 Tax=Enterococcus faecalis TaxID=1351 RepID=UPI000C787314|nr:hypothetical protein [Enterococcus faecalis]PLA80862.1 hypothetical protein CYR81_06950 [Enterococcus faecalis]